MEDKATTVTTLYKFKTSVFQFSYQTIPMLAVCPDSLGSFGFSFNRIAEDIAQELATRIACATQRRIDMTRAVVSVSIHSLRWCSRMNSNSTLAAMLCGKAAITLRTPSKVSKQRRCCSPETVRDRAGRCEMYLNVSFTLPCYIWTG